VGINLHGEAAQSQFTPATQVMMVRLQRAASTFGPDGKFCRTWRSRAKVRNFWRRSHRTILVQSTHQQLPCQYKQHTTAQLVHPFALCSLAMVILHLIPLKFHVSFMSNNVLCPRLYKSLYFSAHTIIRQDLVLADFGSLGTRRFFSICCQIR